MYEQFSYEKQLILTASRILETIDIDCIKILLEKDIDWEKVFLYGYKNKVAYLVYDNIVSLGFKDYIPENWCKTMDEACAKNILIIKEKFSELENIINALKEKDIDILPVKGAYLIDNVYKNRRARVTNDIDALILKRDVDIIDKLMKDMGYCNGRIESKEDRKVIVKSTQVTRVLYKTKMYNLLPYIKPSTQFDNEFVVFDFSFALDFTLDVAPVEEMIENSILVDSRKQLLPEHLFVHMCCHHYREASHIEWIKMGKDLTIMKFCDVRSFVLMKMNEETMNKAIEFAERYNLLRAVYFTIYCLKQIYNDGYEDNVLSQLNIDNDDFLFKLTDDGTNFSLERKKGFWDSIFQIDNKDEIEGVESTYDSLI